MKLITAVPRHTRAYLLVKESLSKYDTTILSEAGIASDADLEKLLKGIAMDLSKKRLSTVDPQKVDLDDIEQEKDQTNEEVLSEGLLLTLFLASPTIIKLMGKLIDWAYSKLMLSSDEKAELEQFKKDYAEAEKANDQAKIKELPDKIYASKLGKALDKFAHMAHGAFVKPIEILLKGVAWMNKNEWLKKNSHQVAELLYAIIMIGVAGHGITHALDGVNGLKAAITQLVTNTDKLSHLTIDTLKGGDMTWEVIKNVLNKVFKN